ncbi:MAG TPA: hypothetical protein VG651_01545 [Stellaceae bacterium]|nr:hypothetical protein [Stellaceae bacterium]
MRKGGQVRVLLSAAVLLVTASCSQYYGVSPVSLAWTPPPGQLTLSNYRFEHAAIEAVIAAGPDCTPLDATAPTAFDLPFKGTHVLAAAPNADICWRRQVAGGQWTDWNRAFTASGKFIDVQL